MADIISTLANNVNAQENLQIATVNKSFLANKFLLGSSNIEVMDLPLIDETNTLGHSWIVGSSTNGIVGDNINTQDGEQQVVGSAGRTRVVSKIINSANVWRTILSAAENSFWTNTSTTTATVSARLISFTDGQVYITNRLSIEATNLVSAIISYGNITGTIAVYLSADDGAHWELANNGVSLSFANPGKYLKIKFVSTGVSTIATANSYGVLTPIQIKYVVS